MKKHTRKRLDPAVARELKHIKAAHPALRDRPEALPLMQRLASLRCRFKEVTTLIEVAGGANPDNLDLVAESRQLHRAAAAAEKELRSWWTAPAGADVFALMAELRRQAAGLPALGAGALIDGAVEQPAERVLLPRN